jgi:hypothetical protein
MVKVQLEAAAGQAALDRATVRERADAEAHGRIREAVENEARSTHASCLPL